MKAQLIHYLDDSNTAAFNFWRGASNAPGLTIEQCCDVAYVLHLLGADDLIDPRAPTLFADILSELSLPGWSRGGRRRPSLSVHNCAYAFGTLNLLRPKFGDLYPRVLAGRQFRPTELVEPRTQHPRYPRLLAHHQWRVSHWLGGTPSLLWSAGNSDVSDADQILSTALSSLQATDSSLVAGGGFIKLHRWNALHRVFAFGYGFRHHSELAKVGGVAHILWINHLAGRRYVAAAAVLESASRLFCSRKPFMESRPYCLDFDVVQIVRTTLSQVCRDPGPDRARGFQMMKDLESFFAAGLRSDYPLHKLPGALAAYHECALLCEADVTKQVGPPQDIIKRAHWL